MSDKVLFLNNTTRLNLPANRILQGAMDKLDSVVIAGHTKDGEEYFDSSLADGGDVLWLLERMKKKLLEIPDGGSDE